MLSLKYIEDAARRLGAPAEWACGASMTLPPVSNFFENSRLKRITRNEIGFALSGA